MISTETPVPARSRGHVIRWRLLAVASSVVAALAVWLVATIAGVELEVTSPLVGTLTIDALLVIVSALPLALAAWGVLALLERFVPARARRVWTIVAIAVLVFSIPPLALLDATLGTKVVLGVMHLATGLTLILMLRSSRRES